MMKDESAIMEAMRWAADRVRITSQPQVVYRSQPGHYLWCSLFVWENGQYRLTPNAVTVVRG